MKRNLPVMELYEKLSEKYKYDDEASFKDIFYPIILDAFVMYAHMAIRFQIITNIIINIENNPMVYKKNCKKLDKLSIYMNNIVEASNFISLDLYKITKLLK